MNALVTGVSGFIAPHIVDACLNKGWKTIGVDIRDCDIRHPDFQFWKRDVRELTFDDMKDIDYVFHLACYHGNQSSINDPFADHENSTLTSLKLFDRLKDFKGLRKVVYAAAGCAVAEKTFEEAEPTREDAPVSLFHDSPYSISKLITLARGWKWRRYVR